MLHEPAAQSGPDPSSSYKQRLGVVMFCIYALFYVGFTAINVLNPAVMEVTVLLGLNLAVVYGFALIAFALVLAMIYNWLCTKKERETAGNGETE